MEFKNCEQYVLERLERAELLAETRGEAVAELTKENETLKDDLGWVCSLWQRIDNEATASAWYRAEAWEKYDGPNFYRLEAILNKYADLVKK